MLGPSHLPCIRLTPSGHSELCEYSQALTITPNPTTKTPASMARHHQKAEVSAERWYLLGKYFLLKVVQRLLSEQDY